MKMKKIFIQAKSKENIMPVVKKAVKLLPSNIGLVTTIQHKHLLDKAKDFLVKEGFNVFIGGNVLGCNASSAVKIKYKVDAFLYIGSGEFHPIEVALETDKKVIVANPLSGKVNELDDSAVKKIKQRKKGGLLKFYSSKNIGILITTKPGQNNINKAWELENKFKDKKFYFFIGDTLDLSQMENFPFVEAWINTACPRMMEDKKGIVNIQDLE